MEEEDLIPQRLLLPCRYAVPFVSCIGEEYAAPVFHYGGND